MALAEKALAVRMMLKMKHASVWSKATKICDEVAERRVEDHVQECTDGHG